MTSRTIVLTRRGRVAALAAALLLALTVGLLLDPAARARHPWFAPTPAPTPTNVTQTLPPSNPRW